VKKSKSETSEPNRVVKAHTPKDRPERRPLSRTFRLDIPAGIREEGYTYRYILNRAERIEMFEGAWWDQVRDERGKPIRKASGMGEYLLLYKTTTDLFELDLIENRKKPISLLIDKAQLQKDRNSSEYVPEGHEAVLKIN